jgi:CheY-like chemotaxis protein
MSDSSRPVALVVDDDERSLELMRLVLGFEGYRVLTAASGPEALSIIAGVAVDVVLLDFLMPDMSGDELCRRLRRLDSPRHLPIVCLSGLDDPAARRAAAAAGADDFIAKPFDRADLRERLARLVTG